MRRRLLVWLVVAVVATGAVGYVVAQTMALPILPPITPPAIAWNVVVYIGVGAVSWIFQDELSAAAEWLGASIVDFVVDVYDGWTSSEVEGSVIPFAPATPGVSAPPDAPPGFVTPGMLAACAVLDGTPLGPWSCTPGGPVNLTISSATNALTHNLVPPFRVGHSSSYVEWQAPGWYASPSRVFTSGDGLSLRDVADVAIASHGAGAGYIPRALVYWDAWPGEVPGQWAEDDWFYEPSIQSLLVAQDTIDTALRKAAFSVDDWDVGGVLRFPLGRPDTLAFVPGTTSEYAHAWRATVPVGTQVAYPYTMLGPTPLVAYIGDFDVYTIAPYYSSIEATGYRGYGAVWVTGFEVIRTRFELVEGSLSAPPGHGTVPSWLNVGPFGSWVGTMTSLGFAYGISATWPVWDADGAGFKEVNWSNVFYSPNLSEVSWYQSGVWAFVLPRLYGEEAVFPDVTLTITGVGDMTFPWDEPAAPDFGEAVQQGTGSAVWWIVNPVAALSAAFVPTVALAPRVSAYWDALSLRFPFSLAGSLSVPAAVGAQSIPTPVLDFGRGLTVTARPETINSLTAGIRVSATVVILVLAMVWLHRKVFPRWVI